MSRPTSLVLAVCTLAGLSACSYAPPNSYQRDYAQAPGPLAGERYNAIEENALASVADQPVSTFSIDVDTASYSNTRRFLQHGHRPPPDAVRVEELINYFDYDYPQPSEDRPFSVVSEVSACPWNTDHQLVHLGLKGKEVAREDIPPRNLVFLVDVSGSMSTEDKLPLLKHGLLRLASQLRQSDTVSIAVYAGAAGLVLPPTSDERKIASALQSLEAGGSTAGAQGLELAYKTAEANFIPGGINRVILASDGDFNVGISSQGALVSLIEQKRESGVFLSVLGFGTGNLNDAMMEQIADHGNGSYAYIDSDREAERVLVQQASSLLVAIAKDVKLQVEFDPAQVDSYRLVGYENRLLEAQDFDDDRKDAGELGSGHSVTALYEVVPAQGNATDKPLATVGVRYKEPDGDVSKRFAVDVAAEVLPVSDTSDNFRFSAAVAMFGMLLRDSEHRGTATWAQVRTLAEQARGGDAHGARSEFIQLVAAAERVAQ
jgi:Ca-activated chloride channel family protein